MLRPDAPGDIVEFSSDMAHIRMENGESIWLLHTPAEPVYPKLDEFLGTLVSGRALARARVVMLGGKDSVQQVLTNARPARFARGQLRVHHLSEAGIWWHGPGKEKTPDVLDCLERASKEPRSERFDDGKFMFALSEAIERGRKRQQEMNRFRTQYDKQLPMVTYVLMAAMAVSFAFQFFFGGTTYTPTLYRMGANLHSGLGEEFDWWRLLASVFLHGGFMHLAFNTYVVYALGTFLERILGASRYLILVVLSGLCGSLASYWLGGGLLSVGASGAFWGFLGASAALGLKPGILIPPLMVGHLKRVAMFNLVINLGVSFLPRIDMWAHFGGGLMGFALVWTGLLQKGLGPIDEPMRERGTSRKVSRLLAGALTLLMGASVSMAWVQGQPWELTEEPKLSYRAVPDSDVELVVPEGWGQEQLTDDDSTTIVMGYGHLLRDAAQYYLEVRRLGTGELNVENPEATLRAIVQEMAKESQTYEWVEAGIPFLRNKRVYPNGLFRIDLIRIRGPLLERVIWECFPEFGDKYPTLKPETILMSIRSATKR